MDTRYRIYRRQCTRSSNIESESMLLHTAIGVLTPVKGLLVLFATLCVSDSVCQTQAQDLKIQYLSWGEVAGVLIYSWISPEGEFLVL